MREIDVEGLEAVLRDGGQVVDVREPREWVAGHVAGTRLIPMGQLVARLGELDRTRPVHLICGSGNRSGANPLTAQGFDAVNVLGGSPGPIRPTPRGGHLTCAAPTTTPTTTPTATPTRAWPT